tara:strand:+ start:28489 stop:29136 length:648 start_codon:yes stop_codon:yes gene_type:complete
MNLYQAGNLIGLSAMPDNTQNINDSEISLEDSLRRVLQGEKEAFEVVVRQFERPLRAWLAVQSPPGIDVDEIAQQTFIAAYTRLEEYKPGTNFAAWMFTISRYQLMTETTRLRRIADYHSRYAPDFLQKELDRHADEPPEMWLVRVESLQKCLESLGDSLRKYVNWRYREEIPLEEMARRSNRSVTAVKKQLWQIRQKLQQCVEQRISKKQRTIS